MTILTDTNFTGDTLNEKGLYLVDFWATWCGPCRMMAPVVEKADAASAGRYRVGKVDIDEYPAPAQSLRVVSIPTLILFRDGVEIDRAIGARSPAELNAFLQKHL